LNSESKDLAAQVDYYNSLWKNYTYRNTFELERCVAILDRLLSTGLLQPRICDLGCGAGWLSAILGSFGETTGVDLSDVAVEAASKRYPHVQFLAADILRWDHPKEAFDVVVSQEVLEHVEDHAAYLSVARGLLRPGGYLILTTPNAPAFYAMTDEQRGAWKPQPIENWVDARQLRRLLLAQFRDVQISTVIHSPGTAGFHRAANSVKLQTCARWLGCGKIWRATMHRLGYGLHIVGIARKAPE
jgi:2-polyprenyl-3-methyl-5-hydroxy-6-metoxy-1,4-benzoquinol methylase